MMCLICRTRRLTIFLFFFPDMTLLPKVFAIGTKRNPRTKQKAKINVQIPKILQQNHFLQKKAETETINIVDVEYAPLKQQKSFVPPDKSMVHVYLGVSSVPHIVEEDIKGWSFHIEERVNTSLIRAAVELHFHTLQNQAMNARLRTRLATSENEKCNLQNQLKRYGGQLTKLKKKKDDKVLRFETEMARLLGEMDVVKKQVEKVTTLNTSLQLEKDIIDDERLNGWAVEKIRVKDEGFAHGFNEWCSGFITNDPENTFEKFDAETQQWVKDFRVR